MIPHDNPRPQPGAAPIVMRILAIDTSTPSLSVAVTDRNGLLAESTVCTGASHTGTVLPAIHAVLSAAGLTVGALDAFAVCIGPGSFTGLRIGVSTAKGLAAASGKPVAGVSGLDALAAQCPAGTGWVCPMLDARKRQVYFSIYARTDRGLKKSGGDRVASPAEAIRERTAPCAFIGTGAQLYRRLIRETLGDLAVFVPPAQSTLRAATVADLARVRLESGEGDDVGGLVPLYVRKSDAERKRGAVSERNEALRGLP